MNELLKAIADHLTYYGYRIAPVAPNLGPPGTLDARHDSRPIFWVIPVVRGALFRSLYLLGEETTRDSSGFLSFLNDANTTCIVAHYYKVEQLMAVAAWYFGMHERERFDIFFQQYLTDISNAALLWPEKSERYFAKASAIRTE